jgi:hypothetical protein
MDGVSSWIVSWVIKRVSGRKLRKGWAGRGMMVWRLKIRQTAGYGFKMKTRKNGVWLQDRETRITAKAMASRF